MMSCRILIVDEMHPGILPGLEAIHCVADYLPGIRREEIIEKIGDYTGIIIRSKTALDREILERAVCLRFIARAGAGVEKIDEEICRTRDIRILNAPEGNRDALGEHAVGMLLALLNKMHSADLQIREGIWDREGNRGVEIMGKTIGIIGYGNMGSAFARRLSSFGCRVLAYDKYRKNYSDGFVEECDMSEIFSSADILSLHVPLTRETSGFYNEDFFSHFSKALYLVNTARGPVLPLRDLLHLLDSGKILGAALDVLENEKIHALSEADKQNFRNLIMRQNVILTPHVGGWTIESYKKINDVLIDKINALLPELSV
jgi:D-3-phosphoglycerate dehydrogenase / 2-oxoglutarate reductase